MKEKIYTIPVNEAFDKECECPVCELEREIELKNVEFILGPSLMQPEHRVETNNKGFCRRHFKMLYDMKKNALGLSLVTETHIIIQNEKLEKLSKKKYSSRKNVDKLINFLDELNSKCTICEKMEKTMERYIDTIIYLYFAEDDFKKKFKVKQGFCMKHFEHLARGAKKYLNSSKCEEFMHVLLNMQVENLKRIQDELNWFSKKFDYRFKDEPWKNSRDAVTRGIEKLVSFCDFK